MKNIARRIAGPISRYVDASVSRAIAGHQRQLENSMVLQGRAFALKNIYRSPFKRLQDAEFKVFSQFGEDGIIQYLIREAGIALEQTTFIEFGVQDYVESNTRFLLINDNWRGMIIDGSKECMDYVRSLDIYWRHDLTALDAWIDRDNINQLIGDAGFRGELGILSIDIDGNDYWVWEKIEVVNPIIVIVEWNSLFGPVHTVSVPYDPTFQREKAHYSHLFWGTSIAALDHLARRKGYSLVGSNTAGNNLFFVRNDRIGRLKAVSVKEAYVESRFRESRDRSGHLTYLGGDKRRLEILDIPLVDVVSGKTATLRQLDASDA